MKKMLTLLLVLCMCIGLCACGEDSKSSAESKHTRSKKTVSSDAQEENTISIKPGVNITDEQAESARRAAGINVYFDYGFSLHSITCESCTDDGTYVTISGIVTCIDDDNVKYTGEYTVVLTETDDSDFQYKVLSWEVPTLETEVDSSRDYLAELCNYIVKNGRYDSDENRSYIQKQIVSNRYYFLFAKNGEISFWDYASHETSTSRFARSFTCDFKKGEATQFNFCYFKNQMSGGIVIDGIEVDVSGTISNGKVTITSDKSFNCDANDYIDIDDILDSYEDYTEFIESVMRQASIPVTLEQMLA